MNKFIYTISLIFIFYTHLIYGFEFSAMTLNAQNLFDTTDDLKKDDKAYLPIELKQSKKHVSACNKIRVKSWREECLYLNWDNETKDIKLANLVKNIISYDKNGPDILALQEVENINILKQLFLLLEPYGYIDYELLESNDYRGIDTAFISKFKILDSKLHYITFSGEFEDKDTRPILDISININNRNVKIYNVHFPAGYHDVSMRIDSLNLLKELLNTHNKPTIALGDFNVNTKEDNKHKIYQSQEDKWIIGHLIGCNDCKGSYFYNYDKSWSFLDTIFLSRNRSINFISNSVEIHHTKENSYFDTGKPIRFNPVSRKGVSDHLPMVARLELN